jgi:lysophospholipid acyltransferase (LPLAT)-like uncharacterized protein
MKIVPMGVGYQQPWRLQSWDRFAVPKPASRGTVIFGEPMTVPDKLRSEELEPFRVQVQQEMNRLNPAAQAWADTNRLHLPPVETIIPLTKAA